MQTNYYKVVSQLKSFKIIIVAPTCFGLHKPSSGSSQPVLRYVTMLTWVTYSYMGLWVLWLRVLFSPVVCVARTLCRLKFQSLQVENSVCAA